MLDYNLFQLMERPSPWDFLDQEQKKAVMQESKRISNKLNLPVLYSQIIQEVQSSDLGKNINLEDPRALALKDKLLQWNRRAIFKLFKVLHQVLFEKIRASLQKYQQAMTIKYLRKWYLTFVNQCCKSQDFQWVVKVPTLRCLWQRLQEEVRRLLKATLSFMKKTFKYKDLPCKKLLQEAMKNFEEVFDDVKNELLNSFNLNQSVMDSLIELGNIEREQIEKMDTQTMRLIKEIEKKEEQQRYKQHSLFSKIKITGNQLINKIVDPFRQNAQASKTLKDCESYSQNVGRYYKLSKKEEEFIWRISCENIGQLYKMIQNKFSKEQIGKICFALRQPILKWKQADYYLIGEYNLPQENRAKIFKWKNDLTSMVQTLQGKYTKQYTKYIVLIKLFYLSLQEEYSSLAKRYLLGVCQSLEKTNISRTYFRGALKIFQAQSINPSRLSLKFQDKLPLRSSGFNETEKSRFFRQSYGLKKQINLDRSYSSKHIKLERLTYAKPSKNVIFLLSGFLSEDTQKDLEWEGAIRALEDSQMYGVIWKSSTTKELFKYIGQNAIDIVTGLASGGVSIGMGLLKLGANLVTKFIDGKQKDSSNPFWLSLTRAAEAGQELADQLIQHFSDRFITLIGFSMGTEVVRACVERLAEKNQLGIILRIVTLGGIANKQRVNQLLIDCKEPLSWVNFKSNNDLTVRYVYRVCTLGSRPIGSAGIQPVPGHEVENWQLQDLVKGHMDFRNHIRGLCLMAGLRHD